MSKTTTRQECQLRKTTTKLPHDPETEVARLEKTIPPNHVMLLFWRRTKHDIRGYAGSTGNKIIPAKGCVKAAFALDFCGDQASGAAAGHGVTILWPTGRQRQVRAND